MSLPTSPGSMAPRGVLGLRGCFNNYVIMLLSSLLYEYVYIYMYIYMYIYTYLYIHLHIYKDIFMSIHRYEAFNKSGRIAQVPIENIHLVPEALTDGI